MSDVSALLSSRRLPVSALLQNCATGWQQYDYFFLFFKRKGSELLMSEREAKKKRGGWIWAFQNAFRREYLRRQVES